MAPPARPYSIALPYSVASAPVPLGPLVSRTEELLAAGLAEGTRRSYEAPQRRFVEFASALRGSLPVFPVDEATLLLFASHYFDTYAPNAASVRAAVFAVQSMQVRAGHPPFWSQFRRLHQLIEGMARTVPVAPDSRCPVTYDMLVAAHRAINHSSVDGVVMWAAMSCAFFGLLRVSEFTARSTSSFDHRRDLSAADLSFSSSGDTPVAILRIKRSKTDQRGVGADVVLPHVDAAVCPHCALLRLASLPRTTAPHSTPLFEICGTPLTASAFNTRARRILRALGFDVSRLTSHSWRIGGATHAARSGLPSHSIQTIGRWRSDTYRRYIRDPTTIAVHARTHMVPHTSSPHFVAAPSSSTGSTARSRRAA